MYWPSSPIPSPSYRFLRRSFGLLSDRGNTAISPFLPAPYTKKRDLLFLAIDIEAWEHDNSIITELGIAMLDTRDLTNIAPESGGEGWFPLITARHLRDQDQLHRVNKRYVKGDPDGFRFGESEVVGRGEMKTTLRSMLRYGRNGTGEKRKVVLVVHDLAAEKRLMGFLDKNALGKARVVYTADAQAFADEKKKCSLKRLSEVLGLDREGLHNAGNDTVYTLRALMAMGCLKTFAPRDLEERLAMLG